MTSISFGIEPYGDIPRLVSLGEDRRLVEFDLQNSSVVGGVKVKAVHRVEQSAIPTSMLWTTLPDVIDDSAGNGGSDRSPFDTILVCNDQYKVKRFVSPDCNSCVCLKTLLGPTFGGPVSKMVPIPAQYSGYPNQVPSPKYMAYSTREKVIGLIKLPLDGNPNRTMGLIAHCGSV